jgi:2-amino-4-hydroxy-6-hydroxymethyldihydropteridine diphosphokinase
MPQLYLALGSNEGDREVLLYRAIDAIGVSIGHIGSVSSFYETAPWGFESPHPFLNAALILTTQLTPEQVLNRTQQIERQLGRKQKSSLGNYQDRPIDIDLLLYDSLVLDTDRLTLPHPLLHRRAFVLDPLAEIAPHLYHPLLGKTIRELQLELYAIDTSQPSL